MADEATTYSIAAGIAAAVIALKEVGAGIMKVLRRKSVEDAKARQDAREDDAERDQWAAINTLKDSQAGHERQDAQIHTELRTKVDRMHEDMKEIKSDIKTLLRRSTGDIPKGGR